MMPDSVGFLEDRVGHGRVRLKYPVLTNLLIRVDMTQFVRLNYDPAGRLTRIISIILICTV